MPAALILDKLEPHKAIATVDVEPLPLPPADTKATTSTMALIRYTLPALQAKETARAIAHPPLQFER